MLFVYVIDVLCAPRCCCCSGAQLRSCDQCLPPAQAARVAVEKMLVWWSSLRGGFFSRPSMSHVKLWLQLAEQAQFGAASQGDALQKFYATVDDVCALIKGDLYSALSGSGKVSDLPWLTTLSQCPVMLDRILFSEDKYSTLLELALITARSPPTATASAGGSAHNTSVRLRNAVLPFLELFEGIGEALLFRTSFSRAALKELDLVVALAGVPDDLELHRAVAKVIAGLPFPEFPQLTRAVVALLPPYSKRVNVVKEASLAAGPFAALQELLARILEDRVDLVRAREVSDKLRTIPEEQRLYFAPIMRVLAGHADLYPWAPEEAVRSRACDGLLT